MITSWIRKNLPIIQPASVRLLTLIAFFNFSGIHNGYSAIHWSAPNVSHSVESVFQVVQSVASSVNPIEVLSPFIRAQRFANLATVKLRKGAGIFFQNLLPKKILEQSSSLKSKNPNENAGRMEGSIRFLALGKYNAYAQFKKEDWDRFCRIDFSVLSGFSSIGSIAFIVFTDPGPVHAPPRISPLSQRKSFLQNERSDCNDEAAPKLNCPHSI